MIHGNLDLDVALADVTVRLEVRFRGRLAADTVRVVVAEAARTFADARVTRFVPTLVERRSLDALEALTGVDPRDAERALAS